ncbi:DUF2867 domain-containing protein [Roseibium sp.]|uniref:DUF2867 domain-containing protein n=1 Tax=Roseibium sp. TaxID=1936156 RepID=UPI003D13162A
MSEADTLPDRSLLYAYRAPGDFLDCYSVSLGEHHDLQNADMRVLADLILNADIAWMRNLMALRDRVARFVGMKSGKALAMEQAPTPVAGRGVGERIGFFKIYQVAPDEIILGEDDWHQDFRLTILRDAQRIYAATCCRRHNVFGHAYLALILPFHKLIVKSVLDKAVKASPAAA